MGALIVSMRVHSVLLSLKTDLIKRDFFPASAEHIEKCTGCAMCAQMCPEIAIEVLQEA